MVISNKVKPTKQANTPSAVTGGRFNALVRRNSHDSALRSSGGGLSGLGSGVSSASQPNSTPPDSPLRGGAVNTGGERKGPPICFSPKTCLEVLPTLTKDQLEFEMHYMNIKTNDKTRQGYVNAIRKELSKFVCIDFTNSLKAINDTISSFSCLAKRVEDAIDRIGELSPLSQSHRQTHNQTFLKQ